MHTAEKREGGSHKRGGGSHKKFIIPYMLHFLYCSASCAAKTFFYLLGTI